MRIRYARFGGKTAEAKVKVIGWEPLKKFTTEVQMRVCRLKMRMLRWECSSGLACAAVDSHGVVRIPWYISSIEKWGMNPRPNIQVVKETPARLLVGVDRALGPVVTMKVVNMAIEKAKKAGICWALIG